MNQEDKTPRESPNEATGGPRMEIAEILFSFKGRIPRATFWTIFLPIVVINIIAISLIASSGDVPGEVGAVFGLVLLVECWIMLATQVKRYHDMDISGWMVLINAIPYLGSVIAVLWLGCGKGTDGPNRFGEGPLISRRQS